MKDSSRPLRTGLVRSGLARGRPAPSGTGRQYRPGADDRAAPESRAWWTLGGVKLYADLPVRKTRQLAGDVLALAVIALSLAAGAAVWVQLHRLSVRTGALADTADTSARTLSGGVASLSGIPLVGDQLSTLLGQVGVFTDQTSGNLRGQAHQLAVEGPVIGIAVAAAGLALVTVLWGITRLRWVRRASAVSGRLGTDDLEGLALSAVVRSGPAELRRAGADLPRRWRLGDPEAIRVLAGLELRSLGLRGPGS